MRSLLLLLLFASAGCRTSAPADAVVRGSPVRPYLAAISVPSLDEAIRWYSSNLDFRLVSRNRYPDYGLAIAILENGSFRLELIQHDGARAKEKEAAANPALTHGLGKLAFWTENIRETERRLRAAGVVFQIEPRDDAKAGTRSFIVLDPAGTWIQIVGRAAA